MGSRSCGARREGQGPAAGTDVLVAAVNLGATIHALPFRVDLTLQIYAQNGSAIIEILLDGRGQRIDFMDDFSY